jgi:hypothetical protein
MRRISWDKIPSLYPHQKPEQYSMSISDAVALAGLL